MTAEVTLGDVALPNGSAHAGPVRARVGTRARARVSGTLRDHKAVRVVAETAATVRAELAGSWLLRHHPPSLADLWAQRTPDKELVPGRCETPASSLLWAADVAVRHVALLPYGLLFGYLWLLHRGVTAVPTLLVTAALVGMWHNAAGGAR